MELSEEFLTSPYRSLSPFLSDFANVPSNWSQIQTELSASSRDSLPGAFSSTLPLFSLTLSLPQPLWVSSAAEAICAKATENRSCAGQQEGGGVKESKDVYAARVNMDLARKKR